MIIDPMLIASIIVLIWCIIGISWFAGSDAPYVPTKMDRIKSVLKTAGTKSGKIFYELGSGDGRVVLTAAKLGAVSNGIEQSWIRVWLSRFLAKRNRLNKAFFFHGNIFDRLYYPADIVYIYMLPEAVKKLEEKLGKELKKGAIVITQKYHFPRWKSYKKAGDFCFYRQV